MAIRVLLVTMVVSITFGGCMVTGDGKGCNAEVGGTPLPSPEGRIVFDMDDTNSGFCVGIFSMRPDGSDLRPLTQGVLAGDPAWSPDGRSIAYMGDCKGDDDFSLCVMNADGSGRRFVTGGSFGLSAPTWSPDGQRLAFVRSTPLGENEVRYSIHVISVDGKGEALVVDEAARPDWSPDGSLIAFGSIRNGPSRIYTIRPDGTGLNVLSSGPDDGFPAWSPDGTRIAFHSARSRKRDLLPEVREEDPSLRDVPLPSIYAKDVYVMDAEGTGETALTHGLSDNEDPAWSPNGTEIVFQSDRENNQYRLFVMDANGARVRRILDRWAGSVDWSAGR